MNKRRKSNPRGPKPEHLKAEGVKWQDAVAHALKKKKPKGWLKERREKKG